jgi:hypothetical protein
MTQHLAKDVTEFYMRFVESESFKRLVRGKLQPISSPRGKRAKAIGGRKVLRYLPALREHWWPGYFVRRAKAQDERIANDSYVAQIALSTVRTLHLLTDAFWPIVRVRHSLRKPQFALK